MPPYMIVSTSGKSMLTAVSLDDMEAQVKKLLDRNEELYTRLQLVTASQQEALRQLSAYVKDEQP